MEPNVTIRELLPEEYDFMEEIMYDVIYQPDKESLIPGEVIYYPDVRIYWDNWDAGKNDYCLVAVVDGKKARAAWIRTFPEGVKGFGYVDRQTPELAIALFEEYRNRGIGSGLMKRLVELIRKKAIEQISLSIVKGNPAIHLYKRMGFVVTEECEEHCVMLLKL